jgi:hypothetical protein
VEQLRDNQPGVMQQPNSDNIPSPMVPTTPGTTNPKNAKLRPEKTVSLSKVVSVRGEVVLNDQMTPRGGVKLVFMNASKPEQKEYVTANAFGEFDVQLPAGTWYLYVGEGKQATYHKQISQMPRTIANAAGCPALRFAACRRFATRPVSRLLPTFPCARSANC